MWLKLKGNKPGVSRITFSWLERSHKKAGQNECFMFSLSSLSPKARLPRGLPGLEKNTSLQEGRIRGQRANRLQWTVTGAGSRCGRKVWGSEHPQPSHRNPPAQRGVWAKAVSGPSRGKLAEKRDVAT